MDFRTTDDVSNYGVLVPFYLYMYVLMFKTREVLSREEAEARLFNHGEVVISLYGSNDRKPSILTPFSKFFYQFDDVDEVEEGRDDVVHMTQEQANNLAYSIATMSALDKSLIVHCHAGICRSSAVMQSYLEYEFGMNSPVVTGFLSSGRYVPNVWVLKMMREAFMNFANLGTNSSKT